MKCALITNDQVLISSFDGLQAAGALQLVEVQDAELVFVDLDAQGVSTGVQSPLVFISSNTEKAILAFDEGALDFLCKPIDSYRLLKTINRAKDLGQTITKDSSGSLLVKNGTQHLNIRHNEISFIEALSDYSVIHSKRGKVIINSSLKKMENRLLGFGFMRVHRSYIVNLNLIETIGVNEVISDGHSIPIGSSYKKKLISRITNVHDIIG